jgi:molybdenum cofactor cytidylyltransferase
MARRVTAVILAAGESRRMGQPKMLLPWGDTTVLGQVLSIFAAGFNSLPDPLEWDLLVVTGGARQEIETFVESLRSKYPLRTEFNPSFAIYGMLGSIQAGIQSLDPSVDAALIGLGDQPQVQAATVRAILAAYLSTPSPLVVPSYNLKRGHPWLVSRSLWPQVLSLSPQGTPRQFLNDHTDAVEYIPAGESILMDLDTPEDYDRFRP